MPLALYYAKFYDVLMKSDLPRTAQTVLTVLADMSRKGCANPKLGTLSKEIGTSSRTVKRALRVLRERTLIEITWGQRQSTYRVEPPERWPELLNPVGTKVSPQTKSCGDKNVPSVGTKMSPQNPSGPITVRELSFKKQASPPARSHPNGIEGIVDAAIDRVLADGVPLPARYVRNEYGREEINPDYQRMIEALRQAAPRILAARKPVAFARKIILDEVKGA